MQVVAATSSFPQMCLEPPLKINKSGMEPRVHRLKMSLGSQSVLVLKLPWGIGQAPKTLASGVLRFYRPVGNLFSWG